MIPSTCPDATVADITAEPHWVCLKLFGCKSVVIVERCVAHMEEGWIQDISLLKRVEFEGSVTYSAFLPSLLLRVIVEVIVVGKKSKVPSPLKSIISVRPILADFNNLL